MRTWSPAVGFLAITLVLGTSACGDSESAPEPTETPTPVQVIDETDEAEPEEATPEATPEDDATESIYGDGSRSERGHLLKEVGQTAALGSDLDSVAVSFTVTDIETNFTCTSSFSEPPQNGNFIALSLDIQTTPELADPDMGGSFWISEHDFTVLGPDGTRENDSVGNAYFCLEQSEQVPVDIGPGETVSGKMFLIANIPRER